MHGKVRKDESGFQFIEFTGVKRPKIKLTNRLVETSIVLGPYFILHCLVCSKMVKRNFS